MTLTGHPEGDSSLGAGAASTRACTEPDKMQVCRAGR